MHGFTWIVIRPAPLIRLIRGPTIGPVTGDVRAGNGSPRWHHTVEPAGGAEHHPAFAALYGDMASGYSKRPLAGRGPGDVQFRSLRAHSDRYAAA